MVKRSIRGRRSKVNEAMSLVVEQHGLVDAFENEGVVMEAVAQRQKLEGMLAILEVFGVDVDSLLNDLNSAQDDRMLGGVDDDDLDIFSNPPFVDEAIAEDAEYEEALGGDDVLDQFATDQEEGEDGAVGSENERNEDDEEGDEDGSEEAPEK